MSANSGLVPAHVEYNTSTTDLETDFDLSPAGRSGHLVGEHPGNDRSTNICSSIYKRR